MRRTICMLLALTALAAPALGERAYRIGDAALDEQALLAYAFGEDAGAAFAQRKDGRMMAVTDGDTPLAIYGGEGVAALTIFTHAYGARHLALSVQGDLDPSGVAGCALTREQAVQAATDLLAGFGLPEMTLSHTAAHGHIPGAWDGYRVVLDQTLSGLRIYQPPMRWADAAPTPLRVDVFVGDDGVVYVDGNYAALEPTGPELTLIAEDEALAAFARYGIEADSAERCYLLLGEDDVRPAYRVGMSYIDAATGEALVILTVE